MPFLTITVFYHTFSYLSRDFWKMMWIFEKNAGDLSARFRVRGGLLSLLCVEHAGWQTTQMPDVLTDTTCILQKTVI